MWPPWELALPAWGVVPFSWEAWEDSEALCLSECLTAWLLWKTLQSHWGISLSTWEALSLDEHLAAWVGTKLLPAWEETKLLLDWGLLPSWEVPSLERVLLLDVLASWEAVLSWGLLPPGKGFPWIECYCWEMHWLPGKEDYLPAHLQEEELNCYWLGIASLLGNTFPGGIAIGGNCTGFLGSSTVQWKVSACLTACLQRASCYPSGLRSFPSYISFHFVY